MKDPPANLKQIDINFITDVLPPNVLNISSILYGQSKTNSNSLIQWISSIFNSTQQALTYDKIQTLIKDPDQNFDLVVVEWFHNELFAGLAAIFQCPLVWSSSVDVHASVLRLVDEEPNPSYTQDIMEKNSPPFTFMQRVTNVCRRLWITYIVESSMPIAEVAYKEIYEPAARLRGLTLPPYQDLIHNASLLLANSHSSLSAATKLPQNVKCVGGYHIDVPTKPLSGNLQMIMDESKHGVIYFSLGSFVKSKDIPDEMKTSLLKMFGRLKQTVLWKFEEELTNLPKNVHIQSWMPQPSILAHPNIKIFITHGGLLSTTETAHFGVPIIGIPILGDQFLNVERAVNMGFGFNVRLSYNLADDLKKAIEEVLTNSSYATTVKRVSALYHDRPMRTSEELVYWLEYAVRTGGAPHLRSAALLLAWYQRLYLDLLALLIALLIALVLLVKKLTKLCGLLVKKNDIYKKNN